MTVLALVGDLTMQSQLVAAAARNGVPLEVVGSLDALIEKVAQTDSRSVILDLSEPRLDPQAAVARLLAAAPALKVVGFGPHVHRERLEAAREAGCHLVISRGEFHARMDQILKAL